LRRYKSLNKGKIISKEQKEAIFHSWHSIIDQMDGRTQDNHDNGGATKTYLRTIGAGCNNITLHM
jgi:hypothetical protein